MRGALRVWVGRGIQKGLRLVRQNERKSRVGSDALPLPIQPKQKLDGALSDDRRAADTGRRQVQHHYFSLLARLLRRNRRVRAKQPVQRAVQELIDVGT